MQKPILIIGRQGSGKSTKARELVKEFKEDEVYQADWLGHFASSPYVEQKGNLKNLKAIVFDEIPTLLDCLTLFLHNYKHLKIIVVCQQTSEIFPGLIKRNIRNIQETFEIIDLDKS